jgi:hypothetical protein
MNITYKHIKKEIEYDGSQIDPSWAFKSFGIKGSSIITWIGSMNIKPENLKDFEDVGLEIKADKMIHFILEHFDCQPANMRISYSRQRIFVMLLKEELSKLGISSLRKGDDIYINSKKLTVSIAIASISSMKVHLAINLTSKGTPNDVETVGLFELFDENNNSYFTEENLINFINNVVNSYINEIKSIELDISKTNL